MKMNCKPIPALDERINEIRSRTAEIVNDDILPNEELLWSHRREGESMEHRREVLELRAEVKEKVKKAGLWAPHLPKEYGGMGLDFLEHAYMNEVLAYAGGAAPLRRCCAEFRQPDDPREVRHGRAEAEMAGALDRRKDGVRVLHDRTRRAGLGSARHQDDGASRERRMGHQWAQVVHVERIPRGLPDRHVPDGGRGTRCRPHDADHRADDDTRRAHRPRRRGLGPPERSLRNHLRQCAESRKRTRSARRDRATRRPRTGSAQVASSTA